jgi:hypothetical protein
VTPRAPRVLLAFSALLAAMGAALHASAYKKAAAAVDASNLAPFFGKSLKGLWLGDSATLILVAMIFAFIAARPTSATRPVVMLVALIPAATAVLLYVFLGNFFAGHLLLLIAALGFVAGMQFPASRD